jgi:hypothetical protein
LEFPALPTKVYLPECVEGYSVLKNPLALTFSPQIEYQTRRFWGFPSSIGGQSPLDIDFFNTLANSANFALTEV